MSTKEQVRVVLRDVLQLGSRAQDLEASTELLGNLAELDSMAVATVITALEDRFEMMIDDDEISAETFETFGSLCKFIEMKQAA
ncbi:MAG: acyl carrier protein [Pseudomonadota bacterium]